jgi:hypothetical protein
MRNLSKINYIIIELLIINETKKFNIAKILRKFINILFSLQNPGNFNFNPHQFRETCKFHSLSCYWDAAPMCPTVCTSSFRVQ